MRISILQVAKSIRKKKFKLIAKPLGLQDNSINKKRIVVRNYHLINNQYNNFCKIKASGMKSMTKITMLSIASKKHNLYPNLKNLTLEKELNLNH